MTSTSQGTSFSLPLHVLRSRRAREGKFPTLEDRWQLVEAYVRDWGLVRHHIESFNDFVERQLQKMVNEVGIVETEIKGLYVKLESIEVERPRVKEADGSENLIYPMEARLRNLTYAAPIYLTMRLYVDGNEYPPLRVYIGDLPIMVRSKRCNLHGLRREEIVKKLEDPDDFGGYFIVNGSERVLVSQEDLAPNRPFYDYGDRATITHVAKVTSVGGGYRVNVTVERHKDGVIYVITRIVPVRIPFPVVMRALGLETDEDIVLAVSDDPEIQNEVYPSLVYSAQIAQTVDDARDYIGSKVAIGQPREVRIERAMQILDRYLFPHIGTSSDRETRIKKALFLGQIVKGLIELALGRRKPDDKDHIANKRIRVAGELMAQLFRAVFRQFIQDLRQQLERSYMRGRVPSLVAIVRPDIITERIKHALATGTWVGGKTGVSQMLDRTNMLSTLSHLRRVVSSLSRVQPHFEARDLHPTQWGRLCAIETPEGQNCGLVKNMALLASITIGVDEREVEHMLYELGVKPVLEARRAGVKGAEVYLNGRLVGVHTQPENLVKTIKELRRRGVISHEVNIAYLRHRNEVRVNCDGGRIRRPVLIVENGKLKLKPEHIEKLRSGGWRWDDLVRNGIVEYLDGDEEEDALICVNPEDDLSRCTHMEIIPSVILGAIASIIPYLEHNQAPRNTYEAAMAKQGLGLSTANFMFRLDSRGHFMIHPERPLVTTKGIHLVGYDRRPAGQNAVVALLSYTGYNMEDAIIMNKASIDRGMFRSFFFRTYETEEIKYAGGEEDRIEIPSSTVRDYRGIDAYAHLEEDGIVAPEVFVSSGEVLIGKTSPPRFYVTYAEAGLVRRDSSVCVKRGEKGVVDKVVISETNEGYKLVKVRVREERIPELGDKFASRHGQKGVIGMILPAEDMPFTEDGITPDIIVNPHALPSRMTVGQLLESVAGKIAALKCVLVEATPFEGVTEEELKEMLIRLGFRWDGKEVMYSGITGEKLEADVFIGIVYYQKLHHMVADKIHARARGPVQILTRQPTEGRSREGGLRLGEMERDVLIAHGAAALLRERLVESSDKYVMYVCEDCGLIAWYDYRRNRAYCPAHGDKGRIARVLVPYAFKLLLQELMSLGIYPRLELRDLVE